MYSYIFISYVSVEYSLKKALVHKCNSCRKYWTLYDLPIIKMMAPKMHDFCMKNCKQNTEGKLPINVSLLIAIHELPFIFFFVKKTKKPKQILPNVLKSRCPIVEFRLFCG